MIFWLSNPDFFRKKSWSPYYRQRTDWTCNKHFFRGPDGYYMPESGRCTAITCNTVEGSYTSFAKKNRYLETLNKSKHSSSLKIGT